MAHKPIHREVHRLLTLEVSIPPSMSRAFLHHVHLWASTHNNVEVRQVKNKRAPPDTKLRAKFVKAVDALREIAGATGHPGVSNHMRKLARDTLREIA